MNYGMTRLIGIMIFLWVGAPFCATAAEAEAGSGERSLPAVGERTAQWLDIQRDGRAAGNLLPIPGAEAGPSYRRYIETFGRRIPDTLLYPVSGGGTSK